MHQEHPEHLLQLCDTEVSWTEHLVAEGDLQRAKQSE
jgi:hypothetical protein